MSYFRVSNLVSCYYILHIIILQSFRFITIRQKQACQTTQQMLHSEPLGMSEKVKGYVYILTNPSFREDWVKIGKSSRPVNLRSKELDNTAVPLPFEIFATLETVKFNEVEKLVHKTIDRLTDLRIRQNREFFNVPPQIALDIFRDIATTVDDAVVLEYKDNKPVQSSKPTTPNTATAPEPKIATSETKKEADDLGEELEERTHH